MIALALLLAAAEPADAVAAERAFAAAAQSEGQWRAFARFADPYAIMFVPEPTRARAWLKDRAEPAVPVMWWPATSFESCDGTAAVNTGPWVRAGSASFGTFTTVWQYGTEGFRWRLDHGRDTPGMVPAGREPKRVRPDCARPPTREQGIAYANRYVRDVLDVIEADKSTKPDAPVPNVAFASERLAPDLLYQAEGAMPATGLPADLSHVRETGILTTGNSDDNTLRWSSHPLAGVPGAHDLIVEQWRGPDRGWQIVLYETIGLAKP